MQVGMVTHFPHPAFAEDNVVLGQLVSYITNQPVYQYPLMSRVRRASRSGRRSQRPAVVRLMWPWLRVLMAVPEACRCETKSGWTNLWLPPQSQSVYAIGGEGIDDGGGDGDGWEDGKGSERFAVIAGRLRRNRFPTVPRGSLREASTTTSIRPSSLPWRTRCAHTSPLGFSHRLLLFIPVVMVGGW